MILTGILVGGVDFLSKTKIAGFSIVNSTSDRLGTCQMTVFGKPSDLASSLIPGATVEIDAGTVTTGTTSGSSALFGGVMFGEAVFGGSSSGGVITSPKRIFYGTVITVAPVAETVGAANDGWTQYVLTCRNYGDLLNSTTISTAITYTLETDAAIIADLFTTYLPGISTSGVAATVVVPSITFENISLRQALDNLIALTGAEYFVDVQQILQYRLPASNPAPFGFSETPDNVTTFNPLYKPTYTWDFSNGANRVKVLGQVGSGGVAITSTRNDATSQATYGIRSKVVVDRTITTQAQADTVGDVQLAQFSNPIKSGTVATFLDGLDIGMYLPLSLPAISVSGTFFINKITMTWPSASVTQYVVEWGGYLPNLASLLRKLATFAPQSPTTPTSTPSPGSVGPGSFASTIQPIYIVSSLPALPDTTYPSDSFVVLTTDHKLYRNAGGAWTTSLAAGDLTGEIIATQIADGAISTPKLAANSITAAKMAVGAVVAGTIAAGAIRASDAAFAAAAIQTADIANLAVTNAKVNSLSADKLTAGTIDASVINVTNLNASNISVGTLSGALLADGSIGDIKIAAGLSASKITTGTLSADRIGAGTINISGGGLIISGSSGMVVNPGASFNGIVTMNANVVGFGTNWELFTDGSAAFSSVKIVGFTRIDSAGNGLFSAVSAGGHTVADTGGQLYAQSAIQVAGTTVVTSRKGGWTQPSGSASRGGYTISTATAADVGAALAALIADLASHGLIGA